MILYGILQLVEADWVHCTWIVKWNVIERLNGVENDAELFYTAEARRWQWNYLNHESISSLTRNSIALSSTTLSFCVWIAMHADISRRSFVTFSPHDDVEIFQLLSLFCLLIFSHSLLIGVRWTFQNGLWRKVSNSEGKKVNAKPIIVRKLKALFTLLVCVCINWTQINFLVRTLLSNKSFLLTAEIFPQL